MTLELNSQIYNQVTFRVTDTNNLSLISSLKRGATFLFVAKWSPKISTISHPEEPVQSYSIASHCINLFLRLF